MKAARCLGLLSTLFLCAVAQAQDSCGAYMMDVAAELELFASAPLPAAAGRDVQAAPLLAAGSLYLVALRPQKDVVYAPSPGRRPEDPAKSGGMVKFTVAEAGSYRVSVDANFWIDVLADGVALSAVDFRSDRECSGPRKIVTFQVSPGTELVIQLIDAGTQSVRLAVTPVPEEIW